jgi:hypothetical protein
LLLESELGISPWLHDRLASDVALPSSQLPGDAGDTFKQDVMSYHVKFVVISSGSVNPVWKLVRFSAGDGPWLATANRTRTHDYSSLSVLLSNQTANVATRRRRSALLFRTATERLLHGDSAPVVRKR